MVDELSKELLQRFSDKSYDARQKAMSLAGRSSRGVDREQGRDELAAKKFKANQAKYANKAEKHRKAGRLAKDKIDGQAWVKRKANEEVEMVDEGGLGGGTKSNVTKTGTHSSNLNYITKSKKQGWSDRGRSSAPEKKRASKESRRAGKQETEVDEEIKVKMVKTIPPRKSTVERDKYLSLTKAQKIALARKKKTEVDEAKLRIPKETGTPGMTKASGPMTPYEKSKAFIAAHKRDNKGKHPTQAQHDKAIKEDETVGAQNVITKYKKRAADAKQWKKDNGKTSLGIEETANVGDKNAPVTSQDMDYLSDFYKDVYGTRPRGVYKNIKTVGDYQAEIESLSKAAKDQQNQVKQDRINQKKEKATEKKIQRKRTFGPKGGTQKTTLGPAFKKALAKSRSRR